MGLTQKYQSGGIVDVTQGDDPSTVDRVHNFMTDRFGLPVTTGLERPEKPILTPAQTAYLAAQLDPTVMTGLVDVAGGYPSFPAADVPLEGAFSGEPMPSVAENVRGGNLGIAALQTLGLIPGIGMVTKGRRVVKAASDAARASRSEKIAALRAEANALRFGDEADTSYRGTHQPRGRSHSDAISLDNLTRDISGNPSGYPDDFYGPKGRQYYAPGPRFSGDEYGRANTQSYNAVLKARNNPDAEVTIYRAVPKGIDTINEGDFVTLSPKYAEQHAASGWGLPGDEVGEVISKRVKVKDVLWAGDDINEFGYFPINPK